MKYRHAVSVTGGYLCLLSMSISVPWIARRVDVTVILKRGTPLHLVTGPTICKVSIEVCDRVNAPIATRKSGGYPRI
jgi:hypothetical protein